MIGFNKNPSFMINFTVLNCDEICWFVDSLSAGCLLNIYVSSVLIDKTDPDVAGPEECYSSGK